jgi:DNA-binding IscR family transcriptional regulator
MICASDDAEHAILCDRTTSCTVNLLWLRVRNAITGALDSMTLADLVPPRLLAVKSLAAASGKTGATTVTPTAEQKPIHGALTPS